MESGFKVPGSASRTAYLVEKGVDSETLVSVFKEAASEREKGRQILVVRMNKNRKFQKEQLTAQGYTEFKEFFKEGLK